MTLNEMETLVDLLDKYMEEYGVYECADRGNKMARKFENVYHQLRVSRNIKASDELKGR